MNSGMLDAALADLLAGTGAQVARALDVRTGAVVAETGAAVDDDVPTLIRLAAAAGSVAAGADLDDLVLTTRRAVHVLRESSVPGFFLQVRLDEGRGDLGAARRELASPVLDIALRSVVTPPAGRPRSSDGAASTQGTGEVAARALGVLPARAGSPVAALPQRTPARSAPSDPARVKPSPYKRQPGSARPGPLQQKPSQQEPSQQEPPCAAPRPDPVRESMPSVLKQAWSTDIDTLRRLLAALRRPSGQPGG